MNIVPIILLSVLILLLVAWCIQERSVSNLNFHLDCFLILNNYVKRCFYKILQEYSQTKSVKSIRRKMENIEQFITPLSQKFTKGIVSFPRKNELIQEIRLEMLKHSNSIEDINLFLFPDTLVQKSNPNYYKMMICKVTEIIGEKCHVKTNQEAKSILEAL